MESFIHWLDLCGVGVFAASGALTASRKQMDLVGFCLIATVTGIGGGTLRDLLLDRGAVSWVNDPSTIVLCFAVAAALFFTAHHIESRFRALLWADAVGLAVFCVGGAEISLSAGAPALVAVLMGVMTATFGGILRDVLCAEVPLILRREIYATAAGGRRDHLCRARDGGSRLDRTGRTRGKTPGTLKPLAARQNPRWVVRSLNGCGKYRYRQATGPETKA